MTKRAKHCMSAVALARSRIGKDSVHTTRVRAAKESEKAMMMPKTPTRLSAWFGLGLGLGLEG